MIMFGANTAFGSPVVKAGFLLFFLDFSLSTLFRHGGGGGEGVLPYMGYIQQAKQSVVARPVIRRSLVFNHRRPRLYIYRSR